MKEILTLRGRAPGTPSRSANGLISCIEAGSKPKPNKDWIYCVYLFGNKGLGADYLVTGGT